MTTENKSTKGAGNMGLLSGMLGNAEVVVPEELVADDGKLLAEEKMIEAGFKIP